MKILIAEDEIHIITLLEFTLEMAGYQVCTAQNGLEVLEKVHSERPDLILLDIKMPELNGWQICEKLKSEEKTNKIPIIIVTAFAQKEAKDRSLELGADDFISKPFDGKALLECIQKVMRKRDEGGQAHLRGKRN